MWIMIVMSNMMGQLNSTNGTTAITTPMISVEFSSRERCITAAKFTKKQQNIYNAFCVQK